MQHYKMFPLDSTIPGIQYAGGHLKELQRAVQDPISNFGVVLGEVAKRGRSAIGIRSVSLQRREALSVLAFEI